MFETIIVANPDACRTEAELADELGNRVAIVYEDSAGWQMEVLYDRIEKASTSFNALIENTKEVLSRCVNRRGGNVPRELTSVGALALWLMAKEDGTTIGRKK